MIANNLNQFKFNSLSPLHGSFGGTNITKIGRQKLSLNIFTKMKCPSGKSYSIKQLACIPVTENMDKSTIG